MPLEKTRILAQLHALRESRPNRRWQLAAAGVVPLLTVVTSFAVAPGSIMPPPPRQTTVEQIVLPKPIAADDSGLPFSREERILPGDTVASLTKRLGVDDPQADAYLRSDTTARIIHSRLRPGQLVSAKTGEDGELLSLVFPLGGADSAIVIERNGESLSAAEKALPLQVQSQTRSGVIRNSLFAAADEVGLPDAIAIQMAEIFGADIDFNADLRRGDRFSVVYESFVHEGREIRTGRVLAAEFQNNGKTYRAVWFDPGECGAYYTPEGRSLKKTFLRSPLEFSRVTSGFSMRLHPVFNDWRAHKGVDYAAPIGTSVRGTADGTVEFIGQQRGYGNFIVLRHHDKYTTAYGHLNGFSRGLHSGSRVSQGEVIGYVGRTGWATGPHLHYEFRIAEVHKDPLSVALPLSLPLNVQELARFRETTAPLLARIEMMGGVSLARAD